MMQSNGHLNVLTRDHDSVVTGYGAHDRVVAFLPQYAEEVKAVAVYVRIDHKWKLGIPTDKQIIRAFKKDQFIRGRWKKALVNDWPEMNATEIFFTQGD